MLGYPLPNSATASIIASKRHNVRTGIPIEQSTDLGSAHLRIVDWVGNETLPIVGDAKPFCSVTPRLWGNLHQTNRIGRRFVAMVERAFRAHDRIDNTRIDPRGDRSLGRDPISGKAYRSVAKPLASVVLPRASIAWASCSCAVSWPSS